MYLYNYMYICTYTYTYIHTPHSGSWSIFSSTLQAATSTPHACTLGEKKEPKKRAKKESKESDCNNIHLGWYHIVYSLISMPHT